MATIEVLKTTYFRGRGPQRIRTVLLVILEEGDDYVPGQGFSEPATVGIDIQGAIPAPMRNATVRTVEPRLRDINDFGPAFAALFEPTHCVLDVYAFTILNPPNTPPQKLLQIRAYGILAGGGGGMDEPQDNPGAVIGIIPVELEYTTNSGAEA